MPHMHTLITWKKSTENQRVLLFTKWLQKILWYDILLSEKHIFISVYITTSPLKKINDNFTLNMPSYLCYKGSKNVEMPIWMSLSSSTFIRLDGQICQCTIIWLVSHNLVIWLMYTADEYRSLQTQKIAHRKLFTHSSSDYSSPWHYWWMLWDRFWWNCAKHCPLHKCMEHTGQLSRCVPSPFHTQNSSSSFLACEGFHGPEGLRL